jgi:hypothetical protein
MINPTITTPPITPHSTGQLIGSAGDGTASLVVTGSGEELTAEGGAVGSGDRLTAGGGVVALGASAATLTEPPAHVASKN